MKKSMSILNNKYIKKVLYAVVFIALWQTVVALKIFPEIMFPSVIDIFKALINGFINGELWTRIYYSLYLIAIGVIISIACAFFLEALANINEFTYDLVHTVIVVLDLIPGLALLPLAILWFGIGKTAIIFLIIHSVLWPILLNTMEGFRSTPKIYEEISRNIGMGNREILCKVKIFAAFPSILVGLRTGWARAWRALISSEMVFGATGIAGGLGWDIYVKRSFLDISGIFATLLVIMVIGLLVEDVVFKTIEKHTIQKWGMVS